MYVSLKECWEIQVGLFSRYYLLATGECVTYEHYCACGIALDENITASASDQPLAPSLYLKLPFCPAGVLIAQAFREAELCRMG